MRCSQKGCAREATHLPQICVPAMGWPIAMHEPVGVALSLKLCRDHAREFPAGDQFKSGAPDALRRIIEIMCVGRQPPDFARAFTKAISIDSEMARAVLGGPRTQ